MGRAGHHAIRVQAPICTANKIILTVLEGGSSNLTNKLPVWPYVFIHMGFAAWYQIPVLYNMLKEQSLPGNRTPKAWVLYINNEHGQEYLNVTQTIFGAGNVTAVGHTGTADQSAIDTIVNQAITALNQSGSGPDYDVFCAFTYDPFLSMVMTAFDSTGFDPPGIIMGPGANIGYYEFVNGPVMEGIMVFAVANNKTVITENVTMSMQTMFDLVGAEGAVGPPWWSWDPWGNPTIWAGLEMWKVAVETVGELNSGYSDRVRNILAGFNQTNPCTTVIGDTWYWMASPIGGGLMDYMCMPGQIGQWQNLTGNLYVEIVGASNVTALIPKYSRTANVTYPMTGLWNWL